MPETLTRRQYPTAPASVGIARSDCLAFLATWGFSVTGQSVRDLVLMVSELVTNAVTHGRVTGTQGRHVGFVIEKVGEVIRIEVRDTQSDELPTIREEWERDISGRGLVLVDALSDGWGVREEVIGKTVWAEKKLDTARSEP